MVTIRTSPLRRLACTLGFKISSVAKRKRTRSKAYLFPLPVEPLCSVLHQDAGYRLSRGREDDGEERRSEKQVSKELVSQHSAELATSARKSRAPRVGRQLTLCLAHAGRSSLCANRFRFRYKYNRKETGKDQRKGYGHAKPRADAHSDVRQRGREEARQHVSRTEIKKDGSSGLGSATFRFISVVFSLAKLPRVGISPVLWGRHIVYNGIYGSRHDGVATSDDGKGASGPDPSKVHPVAKVHYATLTHALFTEGLHAIKVLTDGSLPQEAEDHAQQREEERGLPSPRVGHQPKGD